MPLPTGDVIGLMVDNLEKRRTVFPISVANATGWARGLDLPRGGETVIYTGSMYQLLPNTRGPTWRPTARSSGTSPCC